VNSNLALARVIPEANLGRKVRTTIDWQFTNRRTCITLKKLSPVVTPPPS